MDTPTQRQNGFTRSVDKVHSYHFVANDHYNVAHAQTSDRCVENASKLYTGFRLGCSAKVKPNNMAATIRK